MIDLRSRVAHRVLVGLLAIALLTTAFFALRTYRTLSLLRSAYAIGVPSVSDIRGWMTVSYVARTYAHASEALLIPRLGLPTDTPPDTTCVRSPNAKESRPFSTSTECSAWSLASCTRRWRAHRMNKERPAPRPTAY
jgi:hypothetical protein